MMKPIMELLFPPKCVLCGKVLDSGEIDLCRACRTDAPECPSGGRKLQFLDSWTSVWYYEGSARESILRYKFYGKRSYCESYGRMLAMKLSLEHPEGFDILTWVPVSTLRRLRRGYDQVELLAQAVGRELGMEPRPLLKKIRNNPPQSGITGTAQRRANVLGAYRCTDAGELAGKRVLLLDDILTTGSTAGECARVLLTAGAAQVHCGVIAAVRNHK